MKGCMRAASAVTWPVAGLVAEGPDDDGGVVFVALQHAQAPVHDRVHPQRVLRGRPRIPLSLSKAMLYIHVARLLTVPEHMKGLEEGPTCAGTTRLLSRRASKPCVSTLASSTRYSPYWLHSSYLRMPAQFSVLAAPPLAWLHLCHAQKVHYCQSSDFSGSTEALQAHGSVQGFARPW